MTRKSKKGAATPAVQFDPKLMEALVPGPLTPEQANALFQGFKKAVFERALGAELTHHLGYGKDQPRPEGQTNHATAPAPRPSSPTPVLSRSRSRAIATAASSRC